MLPALTGNIRRPGSGFLYLNGGDSRGIDFDWLAGSELARARRARARSARWTWRRCSPTPLAAARSCAGTSTRSPRVPSRRRCARRSRARTCSTVVCDLFLTDTAAFADYVLPAAGFLECDDILPSYFHHTLSAQVKAAEPPGQALRNAEIFRRLAAGDGLRRAGAAGGRRGAHRAPARAVGRELGRARARGHRAPLSPSRACSSPTASRRRAGGSRSPRRAPRPTGTRACPSRASTSRRRAGHLRLLSPASPWLDELDVRQRPQAAPPHRRGERGAASARGRRAAGCATATSVTLRNATGALRLAVELSDAVPPGVAYAPKCRWPSHEPSGRERQRAQPRRQDGHGGELGRARRARRARARVASADARLPELPRVARPAAAATCTGCPSRPSASATARATASRSRAARGRAASRRCSRRRSASTCACTAPRRAPASSCSPTPSWPRWRRWRARRRSRSASSRGRTPPGTPRRWRAARPAARSPRPRAGRSRSCRASPTRAARPPPACAAC